MNKKLKIYHRKLLIKEWIRQNIVFEDVSNEESDEVISTLESCIDFSQCKDSLEIVNDLYEVISQIKTLELNNQYDEKHEFLKNRIEELTIDTVSKINTYKFESKTYFELSGFDLERFNYER